MSRNLTICTVSSAGTVKSFEKGIRLTMERELYLPYVRLSGEFVCDKAVTLGEICSIRLKWGNDDIFRGIPDKVYIYHKGGIKRISFVSRSYTSLAVQNEPEPGVISDVNMQQLVSSCLDHTEITVENNTPVENYIYVKPSSNLWEALTAYNIKKLGRLPYIHGANTIMSTKANSVSRSYLGQRLVTEGIGINTITMLSDVHMRLGDEQYQYNRTNPTAQTFKIKRSKYYELDYQWLHDPDEGLQYKLGSGDRKKNIKFFEYCDFLNEQLFDRVSESGTACDGMYINRVVLTADAKGQRTRVYCYDDAFGQI